jgi:hypothetical protein
MRVFAEKLEHLAEKLEATAQAPLADIAKAIDELFGERIGREQRAILAARHDRRATVTPILAAPRSGLIQAPAVVVAPERFREVPRHNFHPMRLDDPHDE